MIFESFPHVKKKFQFSKAETFTQNDSITELSDSIKKGIVELSIKKVSNKPIYNIKYNKKKKSSYSGNNHIFYDAAKLDLIKDFPLEELDLLIKKNYGVSYDKRVEINDYDQWIPWERYKSYFPIYKYYLNDDKKSVIYVSKKTCTVVQETTSYQRWCARFGAIPHWFYYKKLRLKADLWADVVIWLAFISSFVAISGIIMGFLKQRKIKKIRKKHRPFGFSPYKKKWYKWHHVTGYFFGIFVFTFVFSGMMSLYDVPQWIVPTKKTADYEKIFSVKPRNLELFKLSANKVISDKRFSNIKKIVWRQIDTIPYYYVYTKSLYNPTLVKADNADTVLISKITENHVSKLLSEKCPDLKFTVASLSKTDGYLSSKRVRKNQLVKISTEDANNTWLYFSKNRAELVYMSNKNTRLLRWLYKALHSFNFPIFENHDWLRKLILIILSVFGIIVSISGLVLSCKYLQNSVARRKRNKNKTS